MSENEATKGGGEIVTKEGIDEMSSGDQESMTQSEDEATDCRYSTSDEDAAVSGSSAEDIKSTSSEGSGHYTSDEIMQHKLQWIAEEARRKAFNYCFTFTVLLFTLPLIVLYLTYRFLFKGYFGYDDATSALYAGGVAISIVILLVALFVWIAYKEEKNDAAVLLKKDI